MRVIIGVLAIVFLAADRSPAQQNHLKLESRASSPTPPARRCPASRSRRAIVDTNLTRSAGDRQRRPLRASCSCRPARYKVTFTLAGFATLVQENVELTVGQSVTLGGADEGVGRRRDGDGDVAAASSRRPAPRRRAR